MSGGFGDRNRNELRLHLPAALFRAEDQNGIKRLQLQPRHHRFRGAITGRAYLKDGGYYDDVYEKISPGQWRIKSRTFVALAP
jgi:hypothetical protein